MTEDNSLGFEIKNWIHGLGIVPKRLLAVTIDLMSVTAIMMVLSKLGNFLRGDPNFDLPFYSILILFLLKDLVNKEGSLGKRILQLQIMPEEKSDITDYLKRIIRNITLVIWPIEVIVLIIFKRRIGDMICATDVIKQNK